MRRGRPSRLSESGDSTARLEVLEARFAAEDREDLRRERARHRSGLEPPLDIWCFEGFAGTSVTERRISTPDKRQSQQQR